MNLAETLSPTVEKYRRLIEDNLAFLCRSVRQQAHRRQIKGGDEFGGRNFITDN